MLIRQQTVQMGADAMPDGGRQADAPMGIKVTDEKAAGWVIPYRL